MRLGYLAGAMALSAALVLSACGESDGSLEATTGAVTAAANEAGAPAAEAASGEAASAEAEAGAEEEKAAGEAETEVGAEAETGAEAGAEAEAEPEEEKGDDIPEGAKPELLRGSLWYGIANEDGTAVTAELSAQILSLTAEAKKVFPSLSTAVDADMDGHRKAFENSISGLEGSKKDYADHQESGFRYRPWYYREKTAVRRADDSVLSYRTQVVQFLGGVHPFTVCDTKNLDVRTGKDIPLDKVVTDKDALVKLLVEKLSDNFEPGDFFEGGAEKAMETAVYLTYEGDPNNFEWTIDPQGLTFFFDTYVLGPYSSGPFEVMVMFDEAPELFTGKYGKAEGGFIMGMIPGEWAQADIGNDGTPDSIIVDIDQAYDDKGVPEDYFTAYSVVKTTGTAGEEAHFGECTPMLYMDENGKAYVWLAFYSEEGPSSIIYDVNGETPEKVFEDKQLNLLPGVLIETDDDSHEFIYHEVLFTDPEDSRMVKAIPALWSLGFADVEGSAAAGEDGIPAFTSDYLKNNPVDTMSMTSNVPLMGDKVDPETFEVIENRIAAPEGTLYMPYASNGTDKAVFIADGEYYLSLDYEEHEDGTILLAGEPIENTFEVYFPIDDDSHGCLVAFEHAMKRRTEEKDFFANEDGTGDRVFHVSTEIPVYVNVLGNGEAEKAVNEAILAKIEDVLPESIGDSERISTYVADAREMYTNVPQFFDKGESPACVERTYRTVRLDPKVVSLYWEEYVDLHGAHPVTWRTAQNFDAETGKELAFEDLAAEDPEELMEFVLGEAKALTGTDPDLMECVEGYDENWQDTLKDLILSGSWYLTEDGLTVFADVYGIGPYVIGPQFFNIPTDDLTGYVKEAYLYR